MDDTSLSPPESTASNTWTCTACDTTINIFHRDPHLLTRSHIRNSRPTGSPPPAPLPTHIWRCTSCAETMHIFHQEAHLTSKHHRQRLLRPEALFSCGTCRASVPTAEVANHLTTAETCVCADCKRVVHAVWRERHHDVCTRVEDGRQLEGGSIRLRGRPRATVEPEENDMRPDDLLSSREPAKKCPLCAKIVAGEHECVIMDCALCGTRVNRTHYASHLGTTRHRKAEEARWAQEQKGCLACQGLEQEGHTCGFSPCGVCGVWVDSRFQAVHEATGGHRAAVVAGKKEEERKAAVNETPVSRCPSCKVLIEEGHRCEVVQCDVYGGRVEVPHTATKKHRKAAEKAREQEEWARKAREGRSSEGTAADIIDGQHNWCLSRSEVATDAHRWGVVMLTTDVDGYEAGVEYRVGAERRAKEWRQAREEESRELEREEKERKKREEDEKREKEREKMEKMEKERKEGEEKERKEREKLEKERKKREEDEKKKRKKLEKMEKERKEREEKEKKKREKIEKERQEREEEERKERVKIEGERREREKMEQKEQERKKKQEIEKQEQDRKEREKIEQRQFNAKKEEQRKERAKIKKQNEEQKQKLEKKKQEHQRQAAKQEHTARENTEEVHTQPALGPGRRRKKHTLDTPPNNTATPSPAVPKLGPSRTERKRESEERRVHEPMQTGPAEIQRAGETVGDMEKHEEAERRMQQVRQASALTENQLPEELQTVEKAKRQRGRGKKAANSIASQVQESTRAPGDGGGPTPQIVKTKEAKAQRKAQTQKLEEDEHRELEKTRLLRLEEKQKQEAMQNEQELELEALRRQEEERRLCEELEARKLEEREQERTEGMEREREREREKKEEIGRLEEHEKQNLQTTDEREKRNNNQELGELAVEEENNHPQASQSHDTTASLPTMWTCTLCDREMPTVSRDSHLSGRRHVERERKKQEAEEHRSALAEKTARIDGPNMWDCQICERTMLVAGKNSHLAGSKHRSMEMLREQGKFAAEPGGGDGHVRKDLNDTKSISPAVGEGRLGEAIQKIKEEKKLPGSHGPDTWDCEVCDRTMSLMGKASHLMGKKHRSMELREKKEGSAVEVGPSGNKLGGALVETKTITPIVGESGPGDTIREQEKQTENPPPIKKWNCEVCERDMSVAGKASHLAGKKHRSMGLLREKEGSAVGAGPAGANLGDTLPNSLAVSPIVGESRLREAIEEKQKLTESPPPIKPGPHGKDTWDCKICSRTMSTASKDSHLAGSKHRAMELAQHLEKQTSHNEDPGSREDHPQDCRIYGGVASTISLDPDIAVATPEVTEDGHSEWDDTVQETPQKVEQPSVFVTLRITPARTNSKPEPSTVTTKLDPVPPGQWHCTLCSRTMPLGSQNHHRLGREHRINYMAAKFQQGAPVPRRIRIAKKPTDVSYCECGKKFIGIDWCRDCDFRADAGWGKQAKLKKTDMC